MTVVSLLQTLRDPDQVQIQLSTTIKVWKGPAVVEDGDNLHFEDRKGDWPAD
jgi:hypothetical protein